MGKYVDFVEWMNYQLFVILKWIMKMHHSTEIQSTKEKSFVIKYQERQFESPVKNKFRYSTPTQPVGSRSFISSAIEVKTKGKSRKQDYQIQLSKVATDRPRKKQSFRAPSKLIGSMIQISPDVQRVEREEEKEKELSKIPIEYNDEKAHGNLADSWRMKVVYRGYAPKNTYFFLKSLAINPLDEKINNKRGEYDLQFNSRFESGNLGSAAKKSHREYWLFMREDTNTFGIRQWFYFSVYNKKAGRYKFRIYKFTKNYSLYKQGMKPFIRSESQWKQGGQNVRYQPDGEAKCIYLQFEYEFQRAGMRTEFASQPPYTYTMLKQYIQGIATDNQEIKVRKAGESLAGLEIPLIKIIEENRVKEKSAIIIMARTHPSQVASNYALEGFIERLLKLPELKSAYDFYIIPMVNPDGVFFGNHRTGVLGQDLNRNFHSNEQQVFPEIKSVQRLIQKVKSIQKVQYLLDLHGHSARRNIFAYGDDHPIGSYPFAFTHILPKLLSEQISSFKYDYCVFRQTKEKKNTARVYLSRRYKVNALTFQESYGLIDEGPISIQHWRNFGVALADSLLEYKNIFNRGKQEGLLDYLQAEIKYQSEAIQRRQARKLKKMELEGEKIYTEYSVDSNTEDLTKFRLKTRQQQKLKEKQLQKNATITEVSEDTINEDQLSSGDEDLENNDQGMEILKKQIFKLACLREGGKRQAFNIPQKKIEIRGFYQPVIHQQKSAIAPRIMKFKMKRKQEMYHRIHIKQENRSQRKSLNIIQKSERDSIELPYLRR